MPFASELNKIRFFRLLLYSVAGGGKTTLFRTLPGKKLLIIFDPAGICALEPTDDIEFETFIPKTQNLSVTSNKGASNSPVSYSGSEAYLDYERYMQEKLEEDYFSKFSWVGFDSITSLQNMILDQIANVHGREGRNPQLEDFSNMAEVLLKNFRQWTAINSNVICMAHEKSRQDKLQRTIAMDIMVPGEYSKKLTLLLSDVYHLYGRRDTANKAEFLMDVMPTEDYPLARCSLEIPATVNITLPNKSCLDITKRGFGKILREKGYYIENKTDTDNETTSS